MSNEREKLAKELFADALEKADAAERAAWLAQACGDDAELHGRIEALLQAYEKAGAFLEEPSSAPAAETIAAAPGPTEKAGDKIGHYKLLQQIGEGGGGVVYMAEQVEPIRRRVAFKVIKLGMDTKQVIARFEAERQALALMDHPNIAKVLDAGATGSGRPYFVMELVRGLRITDYCDQNNLPTDQRLGLFMQVCHAIQHAHQKGIIHRDIKPSNILVTVVDGQPVPKVIDFGIAKAIGQQLTEKTVFTAFEQFIGTPAYMSPEQTQLSGVDVDTRSDIYSLGVLLYELLTGHTPFESKTLLAAGLDEMRRIIREKDPPRPSTRLSALEAAEQTTVAKRRQSEPPKLIHQVRGDLDWIVMKCLEKERGRRYETANGLAQDIEHHLNQEPVTAAAPSALYRAGKFIHRHKAGLATAIALVLLLAAGAVVSTWEAVQATRAKAAAIAEKQRADKEAATAKRIAEYTQQIFYSAAQEAGKGQDSAVRQLLDDFSGTLESRLAGQPEVEAAIHATIGITYHWMEEHDKARRHLTRALELRRSLFGTQHEKYAESLVDYATMLSNDLHDSAEAEKDFHEALAIYRARRVEGPPVIHALWSLQWAYSQHQQWEQVEAVFREALAEARKSPGADAWHLAAISNGLASARIAQGRFAEAESILRQTVAADQIGWVHKSLAEALVPQHKFKEALVAAKQSVALMRKRIPPENVAYGISLNTLLDVLLEAHSAHALAEVCASPGELAELELLFRERLLAKPRTADNFLDPVSVAARAWAQFPGFYAELGNELSAAGKIQAAQECRQKANTLITNLLTEALQGPENARTLAGVLNNLAWQMATSSDSKERDGQTAVRLAERAAAVTGRTNALYLDTLAAAYAASGQFTNAVRAQQEAIALLANDEEKKDYGSRLKLFQQNLPYCDHDQLAQRTAALLLAGKFDEAELLARECLALREREMPDDWRTCNARSMLGGCLLGQKKYAEAEPMLLAGYRGMKERQDRIPERGLPRLQDTLDRITKLYRALGRPEEVSKLLAAQASKEESTYQQAAGKVNPARLRDGLVLHLTFDQDWTDGKVTDMSGKANHGRVFGAKWEPDGRYGGAVRFAPPNQFIIVSNSASLNPPQLNVAAWIKTSRQDDVWRRVADKDWRNGFALSIGGMVGRNARFKGRADMEIAMDLNKQQGITTSAGVVTDGQWHHLAATYDGTDQFLYVDGVRQSRGVHWQGKVPTNSYDLTIGINLANPEPSEVGASFDGLIDEVMLFNRALSPEEIASLLSSQ